MPQFEAGLYQVSSLFLIPALVLILAALLYAVFALGAFLIEGVQRRRPGWRSSLSRRQAQTAATSDDLELMILKDLEGLRIVVDCAHGAAYKVAPTVLWELGAEVVSIGVAPDGFNINAGCGSTAPQALATLVRERRADLGIALDGDADRVVLVDEAGVVVDGDQILALIAESWAAQGRLRGGEVVATVMSNLGLERFLQGKGLTLHRTKVGDRYVGRRCASAAATWAGSNRAM